MKLQNGKFRIAYSDRSTDPVAVEKDGLVVGRLQSCDVVLNHRSVSRVHAGINRIENDYVLMNLSVSNSLTLNGRLLSAEEADVLADGDIIQVGPFTITVNRIDDLLDLAVLHQFSGGLMNTSSKLPPIDQVIPKKNKQEMAGVLSAFWEKRTREKEDWGTRLRPAGKPVPGKALINWKPTSDLQKPWRIGLFVWVFLIFGALAVFAFFRFPNTYASKPLSDPHGSDVAATVTANRSNSNSCTTCHSPGKTIASSCVECHQAEQFHASNTKVHQDAGITCTTCHLEHQGKEFQMKTAAVQGCAECHNDNNTRLYNGKAVRTAHGGTFGSPVENGKWIWKGLYKEIAETIPAANVAVAHEDPQSRLSREFHSIHLYRLKPVEGMQTDSTGRVSCSSCHKGFDPVDRETPYQTCAQCHSVQSNASSNDSKQNNTNCVSCHVQHPFSRSRWSETLTGEALKTRQAVIDEQIKRQKNK